MLLNWHHLTVPWRRLTGARRPAARPFLSSATLKDLGLSRSDLLAIQAGRIAGDSSRRQR